MNRSAGQVRPGLLLLRDPPNFTVRGVEKHRRYSIVDIAETVEHPFMEWSSVRRR
jgi:hypothetical protein